jgi:exonuclease SbcD
LHLGKSFHKINLIDDQRYVLDQIVELMEEQKANIVIAGDVFDSANPSLEAQELFLYFASRVIAVCQKHHLRCWITVGNHDSTRRLMLFSEFLKPCIAIVDECMTTVVDDVKLCFLSFVKPTSAELKFGKGYNSYSEAFNAYIEHIQEKEHTVLVVHQSFENCTTGHSEVMTFFDDAIMLNDVEAFPLVLAAHIHKRQKVGTNVYYCGSLLPYAFGDAYTKDIRVWHIEGTQFTYTDYPIEILHDLQVIRGDLQYCLAQPDTGAFVKVELTDDSTPEFAITELKAHFKNLITVTSGIADTWEADLDKPTAQFATITEAIDSFCTQIDVPEFTEVQKAIIEELLNNEDTNT